jgi:hypothetical protein
LAVASTPEYHSTPFETSLPEILLYVTTTCDKKTLVGRLRERENLDFLGRPSYLVNA